MTNFNGEYLQISNSSMFYGGCLIILCLHYSLIHGDNNLIFKLSPVFAEFYVRHDNSSRYVTFFDVVALP